MHPEPLELTREQILERISISAIRHYKHGDWCNYRACSDVVLAQLLDDDDPVLQEYRR